MKERTKEIILETRKTLVLRSFNERNPAGGDAYCCAYPFGGVPLCMRIR